MIILIILIIFVVWKINNYLDKKTIWEEREKLKLTMSNEELQERLKKMDEKEKDEN